LRQTNSFFLSFYFHLMASPSLKYTSKLVGQRVLVFGGTSGIGFSVAEAAFEHGAHLVISSSNQSKLDKTISRLKAAYPAQSEKQTITTRVCDLADAANLDANIQSLFETATNGGTVKLNHVAFTAGDMLSRPSLEDLTPDVIYSGMNVRFVAPAVMAKYIHKYVELSPASSFTITSGVRSKKPAPGWTMATAIGSAAEGLARDLAMDLKPIRVNAVSPGAVHTELFSLFPNLDAALENFRQASTTGTVGKPEDLAESYIYLMKDQFVTGTVIESNGGCLLV
jgi:NAD(P)-dependent dehydrogenase (short-subunit alcohol dehydrogenase family)